MNKDKNTLSELVKRDARFRLNEGIPKTMKEMDSLLVGMSYDQLTPEARSLYLELCNVHHWRTVTIDEIGLYTQDWLQQDVQKGLNDLLYLGYLVEIGEQTESVSSSNSDDASDSELPCSIIKNKYDSSIIRPDASPIAVGMYIACIECNHDGFVTWEDINQSNWWTERYLERGFEELEKLGYVKKTGWYVSIDDVERDYYAFRNSLNKSFPDAEAYFEKKDKAEE